MENGSADSREPRSRQGTAFGSGWISGILSIALGAIALGAVLCFHFPSILTVPELRSWYPLPYIRALLHLFLVSSFVLGVFSLWLRRRKVLGLAGISLTLAAALLGGSRVAVEGELREGPYLGLDWFLLNLMFYSAIFIPLERLFAHRPEQPLLRAGWRTDLAYFFVSAVLIQVTTLLTLKPAMIFFDWMASPSWRAYVGALPFAAQFAAILALADLTQYWVHRLFHRVPALWRFHAIHHSAHAMDWLAGSRLHLVDVAVTRALSYVPIHILGFAELPLYAYIGFVSVHATFIHANLRFGLGPLNLFFATPRFHHWHHAIEKEAIDRNFAVHLPLLDRIFGTYYLPDKWPEAYGCAGDEKVPDGYAKQFVQPFKREEEKPCG